MFPGNHIKLFNGVLTRTKLKKGSDADDFGAAVDLSVQSLDRVGAVQLGTVCRRETHIGEDVGFSLVHELGELSDLGPDVVGHLPPLSSGGLGVILGEGGGDEGGDDAAPLLAGMSEGIAHEVDAAALPGAPWRRRLSARRAHPRRRA